jgi:hypothetical protein
MIGVCTRLKTLVLTRSHAESARQAGYDADMEISQLIRQVEDTHALAKHILDNIRRANSADPNGDALAEVTKALS